MSTAANHIDSQAFYGKLILAPLTRGGNLPFRRLCKDFGADITVSEMAYARQLLRGEGREKALLRHHAAEVPFGVQLAVGKVEEAVRVVPLVVEAGASFIDINAGCPIHDTVRRGMGACLLERPKALARIVAAMVDASAVPVTVKIRAGWSSENINALEVGRLVADAGAMAVTLHGRTREQRYSRSANWELVRQLTEHLAIPVVGNGDILTWYEADRFWRESGCAALMIGRGALIKPWVFQEIKARRTLNLSITERLEIYTTLTRYMKEHFRDDEKGRRRAMYFLEFQLGFFCRYQYLPEDIYQAQSLTHPLIQTRPEGSGTLSNDPLALLLKDPRPEIHRKFAEILWDHSGTESLRTKLESISLEQSASEGELAEVQVQG